MGDGGGQGNAKTRKVGSAATTRLAVLHLPCLPCHPEQSRLWQLAICFTGCRRPGRAHLHILKPLQQLIRKSRRR